VPLSRTDLRLIRWLLLDLPLRRLPQELIVLTSYCVRKISDLESLPQLLFLGAATAGVLLL
jgi:hypothetical protein